MGRPRIYRRSRTIRHIVIGIWAAVFVWSAVMLTMYIVNTVRTRRINDELASAYHTNTAAEVPPTATPLYMADYTAEPSPTPTPVPTVKPAATYDVFGGYPNNPYREVLAQFRQVKQLNQDICGWITIGSDLDQAVVQRDNQYYLTRDYTGKSNNNGAIFLDEQVKLWKRPTCYILYGHNMKTQEMFGMLHKYDSISYLRDHAIVTFDTQYEEGQFAVFAVGKVSLDPGRQKFAAFYSLPQSSSTGRSNIIAQLQQISDYSIGLDVSIEDQLLVLVTCTGDNDERRFVAARRLRDGETAATLNMTYLLAQRRQ